MTKYRYKPTDHFLISSGSRDEQLGADDVQTLIPQPSYSERADHPDDIGNLQISSRFCEGCGERQTSIMIVDDYGKALIVVLRPSMAIKFGELAIMHGSAGVIPQ